MTAPIIDPQLEAFESGDIGPERQGDPRDIVAYEIAAVVLVGLTLVRQAMAQEKAPVDPSGSAQKLWREHAPLWLRVAVPAVRQAYSLGQMGNLTEDELQKLATDYAANLGDYVSATSADALADGFNRQLAAGWNTEVAWQRATVGYGLERREMRSYLDGVMLGAKGGSADIVPAAARALVDKAILRRADNIGMSESWTAMQTGQALAWMALYRAGRLPAGAMKEWDVAEQATTCAICRYLHGQQVPPDQPFILPDGSKIWAPEVHPRCECRIKLVIPVEISKVDLKAAGVAVRALDTGRVLMLQRALDDKDPASGTWEFPGGCIEGGEHPAQAAEREWSEEVGRRFPKGKLAAHWTSGRYQGFVWDIEHEADIPIHRGRGSIINPDDPDGDQVEQLAWWTPEQLDGNPAVRPELHSSLPEIRKALGQVSKAYSPQERRDQTGRWTKVAERDATVDAIMDEARAQEPEAPNPFAAAPNPFAANPFATVNPFVSENPFASRNPFAQAANPLLGVGVNPFAQRQKQYAQRVLLLVHTPPKGGEARREGTYYLPLSEVAEAYEIPYEPGLEQVGGTVDFDEINDAARATYADPDFGGLIAAQANTPWHAVDVDSALGWTDPEDVDEHWAKVLPLAVQASQRAVLDTPDIAQRLDQQDLAAIFTQAGYDSSEPNESKRSRLVDATQKIGSGNDSLAAAYIDYVVYHRPELFGALGSDLGRAIEEAEAANVPVTGAVHDLLTFQDGFHDNRRGETHLADLHATYEVTGATYHSALLEQGLDARAGAIGVRELFCKPVRTEE